VVAAADLQAGHVGLRGAEGRHAATVRRLTAGERVDLTDGAGLLAQCVVTAARPGELDLDVLARQQQPPPEPRLTAVQAIPKGDRGELAVELLTEAGADVIVPWAAERCVAVWRGDRAARARARWVSAAEQAAKQSRRAWFPQVSEQADLGAVGQLIRQAALAVLLEPDAPVSLAELPLPASGDVVLVIGPEGGISPAEAGAFSAAGAIPARLGPNVLRASTAGAVAVAVVSSRTARWA
jgi:16S rRNA (uracil1498-N3)-methyltransferase